ncbi:arginine-tRNA-protein transferase 1 [Aureobasidium subglaciale]|nr:arginine-tRNA-protein transferase 1 [Aureobasidium subglaciale]
MPAAATLLTPIGGSLPAKDLVTSSSQRRALNVWNKFVLGEEYIKETAKRFPKIKEEKARQRNGFDLLHTVHEAEVDQLKPVDSAHRFEVTLEPDDCTEEKFQLYKNYQIYVHHDEPEELTKKGFERFLCKSPIVRRTVKKEGKEQRLGSFHQCYRLDGRLIAIGVLDLLPHAVSGVYFIYHQDFEKYSFGKLSAMREAALALESGYEFYYMGYYIHECVKMRYKGDYKPQYVLDPETNEWDPLDGEVRELMDQKKYVSLSREHKQRRGDEVVTYRLDTPVEVSESSEALFSVGMPGMMSPEEAEEQTDLDRMRIHINQGMTVHTEDLVAWEDGDINDGNSIKGVVGRYAAMVGPEESAQFEMSDVFNTPNPMLQQQPRGPISEPGPMPNPRPQDIQQDPSNKARSATQSPGLWKPEETRDMLELQRDPVHSETTQQAIQAQQTLQAHTY